MARKKLAKSAVGYEHPAKGANHCGQCRHFETPHSCEIVAGEIDSGDWCERFVRRRPYNHVRSRKQRGEE